MEIRSRTVPVLLALLAWQGCASGHDDRPQFGEIRDQIAFVGSELAIPITAEDPDGDELQYAFESSLASLCDGGRCRAGVLKDKGEAFFRWVPQATDVGRHRFRFFVTDGTYVEEVAIDVEVRSSIGYAGLPRFVQPLGAGATLDLGRNDCFDFDVIVDDPDSPMTNISVAPPVVAGLSIRRQDAFSSRLRWCPTADQARASGFRTLVLLSDDGVNPPTEKDFALVLRRPAKPECAGQAPSIQHTPNDWSVAGDVSLVAQVQDEGGLKHPPIVYFWDNMPADPQDLSRAKQVQMVLTSGSSSTGLWTATLPNPVQRAGSGLAERLFYKIAVTDNDDARGSCDHTTENPTSGVHQIEVSPPGTDTMGDGRACDPCTNDAECGGPGDLCVRMGTRGVSYCLTECTDDQDCADGYICAGAPVTSVDRRNGRLCTPLEETCQPALVVGCSDDAFEDNDTAATPTPFPEGVLEPLVACVEAGRPDADWFALEVTSTSQVQVNIAGDDISDLDLVLTDADGTVLSVAESLRTQEDLAICLDSGTYLVQVVPNGEATGGYGIEWSARPASCGAKRECTPDASEGDDDASSARTVDWQTGFEARGNSICAGDEDWYALDLNAGDLFAVDLTFTQTSTAEDLDLHFFAADGTSLTPCSEADTSTCSAFQGQSVDSDEYYDHLVAESGRYFLVVRGFAGAENTYDIAIYKP